MNDYRDYFIAIAAIFLALALGILIGVSFGESFVVSNQREIIELLEGELGRLKGQVRDRDAELERWEQVKPFLWRGYSSALNGKTIAVLARSTERAARTRSLFEDAGAIVTTIILDAGPKSVPPVGELLNLLVGETGPAPNTADYGLRFSGAELPPSLDCSILLLDRTGDDPLDLVLLELWQALHRGDHRVVAAFPWQQEAPLPGPVKETALNYVDNSDTFWGRLALLELAAFGGSGGFGLGPGQLVPEP